MKKKKISTVDFGKKLCYELSRPWMLCKQSTINDCRTVQKNSTLKNRNDLATTNHFCIKKSNKNKNGDKFHRNYCRNEDYCKSRTPYYCLGCNAYYCIDLRDFGNGIQSTCFQLCHN